MLHLANEQPTANLYDAIVIDEAQDFADTWWPVVLACLKYDDDALYVFSDEGQRIFPRFGDAPADLVTLVLDRNLRNTKQISQTFSSMAPNRMRISTHEGPAVRFVPCSFDKALDEADDVVDQLIDEGWQPSDIAVLATGPRHPEQKQRQEEGWESYWESFWDKDQVFYGHVMGFKGLERPAVVLAVNEQPDRERARERLYVGLSRARDLLVVCGDPAHREVGGPAVLKKIGGSPMNDVKSFEAASMRSVVATGAKSELGSTRTYYLKMLDRAGCSRDSSPPCCWHPQMSDGFAVDLWEHRSARLDGRRRWLMKP